MNQILAPLRYSFNFLELSWLRLIVLFFSWIGVGYVLYVNGGVFLIMHSIYESIFIFFLTLLSISFSLGMCALLFWFVIKHRFSSSQSSDTTMNNDPAYWEMPENEHHHDYQTQNDE